MKDVNVITSRNVSVLCQASECTLSDPRVCPECPLSCIDHVEVILSVNWDTDVGLSESLKNWLALLPDILWSL